MGKSLNELQEEFNRKNGIIKEVSKYNFDSKKPFKEFSLKDKNEVMKESKYLFNLLEKNNSYCFDDVVGYDEKARLKSILKDLEQELAE